MAKVKINLASGASIEKNVLTAFNGGTGTYMVLDNEAIGSMGLPIILVSKIMDNKAVKIVDANEWNAVKENLRQIIAGNQMNYVSVAPELSGDSEYYMQLTLPVTSFDAIKNNYKPGDRVEEPTSSSVVSTPVNSTIEQTPVNTGVAPTPQPEPMPAAPIESITPTTPELEPNVTQPVQPTPVPEVAPVAPAQPVIPQAPQPVQEVAPVETPAAPEVAPTAPVEPVQPVSIETPVPPAVESQPVAQATIDLSADKEAFLKACENMFDALVAKFNK